MKQILIFLVSLLLSANLFGQNDTLFEMSLEELMNVEIKTASKTAERNFDAALSSTVITRQEILNSGANSIMEALRLSPGVIVREQTNGNYDIHLRGMDYIPPKAGLPSASNNITLVMIDNRVVFRDFMGGTFWESLPIDINDVEKIEIVRGPSSALYGPNAVAGVINILTKRPDKEGLQIFADQNFGNFSTMSTRANVSYKTGDLGAMATFNYQKRNRFHDKYFDYMQKSYVDDPSQILSPYGGPAFADSIDGKPETEVKYPDTKLAMDKYGANVFLNYKVNDDIHVDLSSGLQSSEVQKIYVDNQNTPFTTEKSESQYVNLKANLYGAELRTSLLNGSQETLGMKGWDLDFQNMDMSLEYELKLLSDQLSVRPGVMFRTVSYEDQTETFLKGSKTLSNTGIFVRADYKPIDKLRIIGAIRGEQYNHPDDMYFSYQLATTYKFDENNIVRAVASRANKGPGIVETYNELQLPLGFMNIVYSGNKDLDLMTMDMYEFGFRSQPTDNLQYDIETFFNIANNFSYYATSDSSTFTPPAGPTNSYISAGNLEVEAYQTGVTFKVKYFVNENFEISPYITQQTTSLNNMNEKLNDPESDSLINVDNQWTPSYYGGVYINYRWNKLNVNLNPYFYGEQKFMYGSSAYYQDEIPARFLLNATVSYKVYEQNEVYVSARNLFAGEKRQFAFADPIKPVFMGGVRIRF